MARSVLDTCTLYYELSQYQ